MKKLKKEFEGLIITRRILPLGEVTFNPKDVNEADYDNYAKIGFDDLFEDVEILTLVTTPEPSTLKMDEAPTLQDNQPILTNKTLSYDVEVNTIDVDIKPKVTIKRQKTNKK